MPIARRAESATTAIDARRQRQDSAATAKDEQRDRSGGGSDNGSGGGSRASIYAALASNVVIAAAKLGAGLVTASPALLSEAAHSLADSANEVFLLTSLWRSGRAADRGHPFGYGKERFFWSFLAAVGIFVTGGCFSIFQGVQAWQSPRRESGAELAAAAAVLVLALIVEGASLAKALSQALARVGRQRRLSRRDLTVEPALRTVIAEDGTAVVGVFIALGGIGLHALTGDIRWEAGASLAIGVLLLVVAVHLGLQAQGELIGESVDEQLQDSLTGFLADQPEIDTVIEVLTMRLGPDSALLAARVDLEPGMDSETVEEVCVRIKHELSRRWPVFDHVFLDITDVSESRADA
jgi:cation diffusion facilitator family transporter